MTPKTLRRKLQKKKKHRPYGRCPVCRNRTVRHVGDGVIVERCTYGEFVRKAGGCGYTKEIKWSGGGTGRHIPGA